MLVNLTKHELFVINYYLGWKITEINETGNVFEFPEIDDIYNKLEGIHDACTCKEQNED